MSREGATILHIYMYISILPYINMIHGYHCFHNVHFICLFSCIGLFKVLEDRAISATTQVNVSDMVAIATGNLYVYMYTYVCKCIYISTYIYINVYI
jgi:hypothetical protein